MAEKKKGGFWLTPTLKAFVKKWFSLTSSGKMLFFFFVFTGCMGFLWLYALYTVRLSREILLKAGAEPHALEAVLGMWTQVQIAFTSFCIAMAAIVGTLAVVGEIYKISILKPKNGSEEK